MTIPATELRVHDGVFTRQYSVIFTQVYQIKVLYHFTAYKLFKRYSQFITIQKLVFYIQIPIDIQKQLAPFPSKKWIHNTSAQVIEERRAMLEAWMQNLLEQPLVLDLVLDFLEVPDDKKLKILSKEKCILTDEDHCVANLLHTFQDDNRHKSRSLEEFEKHFFDQKSGLHSMYMKILIRTLASYCGSENLGSKSLDILYKLIHSSSYRHFEKALAELLMLEFSLLRLIKLDMHILKQFTGDTSEQALEICLVLYNHLQTQMQSSLLSFIVSSIQLNDNYQAVEIFNLWVSQGIVQKPSNKKICNDWRYLRASQDMCAKYRTIDKSIDIEITFPVCSSLHKILHYITDIDSLKKWNGLLLDAEDIEVISNEKKVCRYVIKCESNHVQVCLELEIKHLDDENTIVNFRNIEHSCPNFRQNVQKVKLESWVYRIHKVNTKPSRARSVGMIEELSTSKQTYEPRSADSRNSYITESLEFASNFEITISHVMDLSIAKMISGELIGETSEIVNSWKSFKHIVEQDSTQDLAFTHKSHKNNYLKALNRKLSAKKSKHKTMCK